MPKVEIAVMDREGTVCRVSFMFVGAQKLCETMKEGGSYYIANATKKELPTSIASSGMEFTGWVGTIVHPTEKNIAIIVPDVEELTAWEQLPLVPQNKEVHVCGMVASVGELEQNSSLRKIVLVDPRAVEDEPPPAVTVALWAPRAATFDGSNVGRKCTMYGLKTREYQGELQLYSRTDTFWNLDSSVAAINMDKGYEYAFIKAAARFNMLAADLKPFMSWAEQANDVDKPFATRARVTAFSVADAEYCKICSARVEASFSREQKYWCWRCATSVAHVRVARIAQLTICPRAEEADAADASLIQDGLRAVAFGSAAVALENKNKEQPLTGSVITVRMSVRLSSAGAEATIHAC